MIVPFLVIGQANVDAVLNRHAKFMSQWSTVAVDVRARTTIATGEGTGRIVLAKPNKASFIMTWGTEQYSFTQGDRRIVEIERSEKEYRDYMTFPVWVPPPGMISSIPDFGFPTMLTATDLRRTGGLGSFRLIKATPGVRAQTIGATLRLAGPPVEYEFKIDELGRLLQIRSTATGQSGKIVTDHYFSNWAVDRKYPASIFAGGVPAGFTSGAMPQEPFPISIGEAFPTGDWIELRSNRVVSGRPIASAGQSLVAVVDGGCAPSRNLIEFLTRSTSDLKVPINLLWTGSAKGAAGLSSFKSRGPSALDRLRLASTPAIYLVDGNGTIKQLWQGFHPSQAATLRKEILAAEKS